MTVFGTMGATLTFMLCSFAGRTSLRLASLHGKGNISGQAIVLISIDELLFHIQADVDVFRHEGVN